MWTWNVSFSNLTDHATRSRGSRRTRATRTKYSPRSAPDLREVIRKFSGANPFDSGSKLQRVNWCSCRRTLLPSNFAFSRGTQAETWTGDALSKRSLSSRNKSFSLLGFTAQKPFVGGSGVLVFPHGWARSSVAG